MKKYAVTIVAAAMLMACEVDKHGNADAAPETKTAAAEVKEGAQQVGQEVQAGAEQVQQSDAGQRIAAGAREAGQGIKQGAGEAAEAAGDALKREGQEAQAEAKKSAPPKTNT